MPSFLVIWWQFHLNSLRLVNLFAMDNSYLFTVALIFATKLNQSAAISWFTKIKRDFVQNARIFHVAMKLKANWNALWSFTFFKNCIACYVVSIFLHLIQKCFCADKTMGNFNSNPIFCSKNRIPWKHSPFNIQHIKNIKIIYE